MKRIGFILLLFTSSVGFAQKYASENKSGLLGDYDFEYRWRNRFSSANDIRYDGKL